MPRSAVSIYTRHFLGLFLARFLWVFVLIQVFAGLCAALVFLVEHPYVPMPRIARSLPDLVLLLLPVSLTLAFVLGSVLFLRDVQRHRGLLWIQLAGRDPRRYQGGILLLGCMSSLLLWWLHASVLPPARFHERYLLPSVQNAPETIALLLERKPRFFRGLQAGFGARSGNELREVSLLTTDPERRLAITAERAKLALSEDRSMVRLEMRDGRLLELDEADALAENLRFDRMEMALDATRLSRPSKTDILD
ncbi:MAG: LptF/LptG family permease, partial [Planctomycetota bacterium]